MKAPNIIDAEFTVITPATAVREAKEPWKLPAWMCTEWFARALLCGFLGLMATARHSSEPSASPAGNYTVVQVK